MATVTNVTDGRTNRRRETDGRLTIAKIIPSMHNAHSASRGKNCVVFSLYAYLLALQVLPFGISSHKKLTPPVGLIAATQAIILSVVSLCLL